MRIQKVLALLLAMLVLAGCAQTPAEQEIESEYEGYIDVTPLVAEEIEIQALDAEIVALTETTPAPTPALPEAVASGTKTKKVSKAVIDYSNTQDGYVMVKGKDGKEFKVECDSVVNGIGFVPTPVGGKKASRRLRGVETLHRVGDCVAIGNLRTVIWRAWDVCMKI